MRGMKGCEGVCRIFCLYKSCRIYGFHEAVKLQSDCHTFIQEPRRVRHGNARLRKSHHSTLLRTQRQELGIVSRELKWRLWTSSELRDASSQ